MRKPIKQWRIMKAEPSGLLLWFDPMTEFPRLYELEPSLREGVDPLVRGGDTESIVHEIAQLQ